MNKSLISFSLLVVLALGGMAGCSISGTYYAPVDFCVPANSYDKGVKDAMAGQSIDTSFVQQCDLTSQHQVRIAYHSGYSKGLDYLRARNSPYRR